MGKGGANPYPGWWATSEEPVWKERPTDWNRPDMKPYKELNEMKERKKREQDQYYKEKSWKQRRQEFEEEFKKRFMEGEFFESNQSNNFTTGDYHEPNDIHPIFKIKKSSSEEDFKKQYKKLILKHHPDKGGEASMFIKIQEAWEVIKNKFI
mgnify:FL=1|jgi:hypothetical protein|tara:strand:+ start:71 stop:526 length:456 start_codon:yes stop_codon:yes gene_type:complete